MKKLLTAMLSAAAIVSILCTYSYRQDKFHNNSKINVNNPFFFQDSGSWTYSARLTGFPELSYEEVELCVTEVYHIEKDVVYELSIKARQAVEDRYGADRLKLGYFFVTEDKIYLIREEILQDEFLTEEQLVSIGIPVCQKEEKRDALKPEEPGWHERIEADADRRSYYGYNTLIETGYYEQFVWEKGIGLTKYKSGYGAEAYDNELYLE